MEKQFKKGDKVVYTAKHYANWPERAGQVAEVIKVIGSTWGDGVEAVFDDGFVDILSASNLEPYTEDGPVKPEDPRTPEKRYSDNVDELLRAGAERLKNSMDTMVYPYSHIGFLAEFLRDFEKIEKP